MYLEEVALEKSRTDFPTGASGKLLLSLPTLSSRTGGISELQLQGLKISRPFAALWSIKSPKIMKVSLYVPVENKSIR